MLSLSYWEILERLEEIAQSFKELSNFEYTVFFCLFCFNFFLFFFSIFSSIFFYSFFFSSILVKVNFEYTALTGALYVVVNMSVRLSICQS